jgi:hypothetical protein
MATSEKRTLSITAKLIDQFTKPIDLMGARYKNLVNQIVGTTKGVLSTIFNLKTAVLGLAASFVSLSTVKSFGEQADALLKLSTATGDNIENLSELQAAFDLAGVKADGFDTLLKALLGRAREAVDGNQDVADSFAAVGVSIEELKTLGPSQLFEQIAEGLQKYGTAQDKAVALGKVLPKQFLELLPILGGGLQKFQAAISEARGAGATVTESQALVAERLNDSLSKVGLAIGGVSRALIEQFGPEAIALFERIAKEITKNRDGILQFAAAIGSGLAKAFGLATDGVIGLVEAIESIPGVNLLDSSINTQIEELKVKLQDLERDGGFRAVATGQLQTLVDLRKKVAELQEIEKNGLAGALRKTRQQLVDEFRQTVADIKADSKPVVGDAAASAVGLPTPEEVKRIQAAIAAEMANDPNAVAKFQSAFRPTAKAPILDTPSEGDAPLKALRAQADEIQRLANLAPGAAQLRDRLIEIQRKAVVLELNEAKDKGLITVDQLNEGLARFNEQLDRAGSKIGVGGEEGFWRGFNNGAQRAISSWTDFEAAGTSAGETIVNTGLDGIVNSLTEISMRTRGSGEIWRAFGRSVLTVLQQVIAKLLVVRLLSSAASLFGGGEVTAKANGGIVEGDMGTPVKAFARGGVAKGPTVALFGEGKSAEAFVPLPDNKHIPVMLMGGGGRGDMNLSFTIHAVDGKDVKRVLIEQKETIGSLLLEHIEGTTKVRQAVQKAAG